MASIETRITIVSKPAEPLQVLFEVINNGPENVRVLIRNTPLEGLKSDCLIVKVNGRKVKYDGYFFKRGIPDPSRYLHLPEGERLHNTVDVSQAYDTSVPGQYEVSFQKNNLVIIEEPQFEKLYSFLTFTKSQPLSLRISQPLPKVLPLSYITTLGSEQQRIPALAHLTIGAQNRLPLTTFLKTITPQEPDFINATEAQKKIILKAHHTGMAYAKKAASNIAKTSLYHKWFGVYNDTRPPRVQAVYDKILNRRARFTYQVGSPDCADDEYAYTTDGASIIYICSLFWEAEDEGLESRAGTIVHEHSHASALTYDHGYLQEKCLALARDQPLRAVRNADNYEYFAEFLQQ